LGFTALDHPLLVSSHRELGERAEARRICAEGLKLFPKDPELLFRNAMLLTDDSRFRAAEQRAEAGAAFEQCVRLASEPRLAAEAQRQLAALAT
jgi:hypothetical protein